MLLGGSRDLVSKVITTLIGVISILALVTESHDPLSKVLDEELECFMLLQPGNLEPLGPESPATGNRLAHTQDQHLDFEDLK